MMLNNNYLKLHSLGRDVGARGQREVYMNELNVEKVHRVH